jgi:hypothetical protein
MLVVQLPQSPQPAKKSTEQKIMIFFILKVSLLMNRQPINHLILQHHRATPLKLVFYPLLPEGFLVKLRNDHATKNLAGEPHAEFFEHHLAPVQPQSLINRVGAMKVVPQRRQLRTTFSFSVSGLGLPS